MALDAFSGAAGLADWAKAMRDPNIETASGTASHPRLCTMLKTSPEILSHEL
jgi:hypothetical protein